MFNKAKPYLFNFILTSVLLLIIAILFQFTPFGGETMLTVDLGQQYIDFYALFKETLTHSPEQFLYSFQKAFGGEMIGLWAYYLLSPFNLIFLLFDAEQMALGVTIITYLKLIAASMSFFYFVRHKYQLDLQPAMMFSNAYTLMSYTIVYMLNIMWLDGLVLLPLIALGVDRIVRRQKYSLYIVSLATLLIAHYYIGYMVCLFLVMYAAFVIVEQQEKFSLKACVRPYLQFVGASLTATLLSGIVLIPTFISLMQNKVSYLKNDFDWETAHDLQDVFSKFFVGSFNFDEMSKGSPNLYAGVIVLLFALYYFGLRRIKLSEKIVASLTLTVFFLAFHFKALDRIWHGGQFPIWYHFRFSFITTFFLIVLAVKAYKLAAEHLPLWLGISSMFALAGFTGYYYWINQYEFLTPVQLFVTLAFGLMTIMVIYFERAKWSIRQLSLLIVVCCELFANSVIILNELSYVDLSKFNDYVTTLDESLTGLRHGDHDFYRIHTTFQRSKNEAMFTHFSGLNHFGSTIEAHVPKLYGYLGLPDGNGFANYTNGTLFTDDFFNIRYIVNPTKNSASHTADDEYILFQVAYDTDLNAYPLVSSHPRFEIYENVQRLGLGMTVSKDIIAPESQFRDHQPIQNQELLLRLIDTQGSGVSYFTQHPVEQASLQNVTIADQGDGDFYTYERTQQVDDSASDKSAKIRLTFSTTSNNPFYFTLPSQIENDNASLQLNDHAYKIYTPFRRRQITNATYHTTQNNQTLSIELLEDELKINPVRLYEFDEARFNALIEAKQASNFQVTNFKHHRIEGTINVPHDSNYILFTIPYDKAWHITVDGQVVKPIAVLNDTLMAIPAKKGSHQIVLNYFPHAIWWGVATSLVGLLSCLLLKYLPFFRKK
ncbi:MAG: YfhO family protein [Aerococcaceae bacterium]|nr:YfhO family protein [Aerococcaceae bacterium]